MSSKLFVSALCLCLGSFSTVGAARAQENVMIVFDGSNSMWGQIEGTAKIEIARDMMGSLLGEWTEDRQVGLMAYGHRRRGDCEDIETLVTPQANTRTEIIERVKAISPRGKTPLTDAVEEAATALSYEDQPATVVLISDGLESCERDPCALASALEQGGVGFTAHVIGFGLGADQDTASLSCIAEETGGIFVQAANANELETALGSVSAAVAETVDATPEPTPEPETSVEPASPEVVVNGPETAIGGSEITITWDPTIAQNDYINIVPVGTEEGVLGRHVRVRDASDVSIHLAGKPGAYEIRYTANSGETLGKADLEITEAKVELQAEDTVLTGANFTVSWTPTIHPSDYVTIVPVGSDPDTIGNHKRSRDKSEEVLTAPAATGLYELRYVLSVDRTTAGTRTIEVVEPEVTLDSAETALSGSKFPVSWTGAINPQDYITIVPVGTAEGEIANHIRARQNSEGELQAPSETGLYEVRYVLSEGRSTVAVSSIEIVDAEVTVTGPETVRMGEPFTVSWTGTVSGQDYVTIVPMGTAEGEYGNYLQVRSNTEGQLQAPAEAGLYELRYVLREGDKTMARASIEVVEAEVTVTGPESIRTGEKFRVTWTGTVSPRDYITIVPAGTAEGEYGNYLQVRGNMDGQLQAPADTGLYELRYVLREGGKTLAASPIEITEASVTVSAPATAVIGQKFAVTWTGQVSDQDYITIVPKGAEEGEFGNYFVVRKHETKDLTAPPDTGVYEVRYVLKEGSKTLATTDIELVPADVTVSGPEQVRANGRMTVSWTPTINSEDYIALVPMGSPDNDFSQYFSIRSQTSREIETPETPGIYELRYVLKQGTRVLARQTIDVVPATAALNDGAQITAPDVAAAGTTIAVSWRVDAESADQRITLASPSQPIFTWIEAEKTNGKTQVSITLPDEPGLYELRFLDVTAQSVLAQRMITVE
jgi:Ca-activated chloride channel family protein